MFSCQLLVASESTRHHAVPALAGFVRISLYCRHPAAEPAVAINFFDGLVVVRRTNVYPLGGIAKPYFEARRGTFPFFLGSRLGQKLC
jgi:hypothetical protein